jgi:alpha-beta hydrolase superfamily lysophospholipase
MTPEDILNSPAVTQRLFFPRKTERTPLPAGAVDLDIKVAEGITIGCRLFLADKNASTILFFHGNGEIISDYDEIGPMYTAQNINLLVTDYRGYGWSDGSPSFSALLADSHVLYRESKKYLADQGYGPDLFVMGRSLGSAAAVELASTHDKELKGLIIESGFAETLPLAETLGITVEEAEISEKDTFNNIGKISKVTIPTFILHGQNDSLIPLWQAQKLHAQCGARSKELQVVPGADHNSLIMVGGIYYFQAIRQFVDRVSGASDWRKRRKQYKEQ